MCILQTKSSLNNEISAKKHRSDLNNSYENLYKIRKNLDGNVFRWQTAWKNVIKMMISLHFKTINRKFSAPLTVKRRSGSWKIGDSVSEMV